ncbi:hypothetical protein D3C87_1983870 [compost metagenome]
MPVMSVGINTRSTPVAPKAASSRWITETLSVLENSPAFAVKRRTSRPDAGLAMMPTVNGKGLTPAPQVEQRKGLGRRT